MMSSMACTSNTNKFRYSLERLKVMEEEVESKENGVNVKFIVTNVRINLQKVLCIYRKEIASPIHTMSR